MMGFRAEQIDQDSSIGMNESQGFRHTTLGPWSTLIISPNCSLLCLCVLSYLFSTRQLWFADKLTSALNVVIITCSLHTMNLLLAGPKHNFCVHGL